MADPVPALSYAVVFAAYTAIIMGGAASIATFTECTSFDDVADGSCDTVFQDLLEIVAVGTIPDAPREVNLLFGTIGLICRFTIIVWLIENGGWAALVGIVAGGVAAFVAWLN